MSNYDPTTARRIGANSLFAIVAALAMFGIGLLLRNSAVNATLAFEDQQNGIRAQLPLNWLLDNSSPDYVFRAEDPDSLGFKTQLQVSLQTVGPDASPQNVVNLLQIQGAAQLADFRTLSTRETTVGDDEAIEINYAYTETELNPFLQALPVVVRGVDIVVLRGNQAVILTYRDAVESFDNNHYHFERLLNTVEY